MTQKINQFALRKNVLAALLIAAVFLSVLPVPAVQAQSAEPINYVAQLQSGNTTALQALGLNIKRQFAFSSSPEFQNIFSFTSNFSLADIQARLAGSAEFVEVDQQLATSDSAISPSFQIAEQAMTTNDPGFTSNPLNIDKEWGLPYSGFDYAWSKTTGSPNNVVAIVDTGLDATHQDLQNLRLVDGYNFITSQPISGRVNSDDNGHGTLVAGVLGASADNGVGIVGTNWTISVMPLKALDATGKGDSDSVAQAIVWSADHGANLINLSLGGVGFAHDVVLANAISYAFNKGAIIVAAGGNDAAVTGGNLDQEPVYPVCDDNGSNMIIGVAAIDQNSLKPQFSNYGSSCIDVVAPGKRILSTINFDPLTKTPAPNSYAYASGTSLAVPFVVGEAALLKAEYPQATNVQIRDQILGTADPVDSLNLSECNGGSCTGMLGTGRIDVRAAIDRPINQTAFSDGDLVSAGPNGQIYQIVGSQKRPISTFVLQQRFSKVVPKQVTSAQLNGYSDGPYVAPQDGTLVQTASSPVVYMMERGQKLPITHQIFLQRNLDFSKVAQLSDAEVNSWLTSNLLPPAEGTLVRTAQDKTVYWVVGDTLHPVNYNFYIQRGLNIFPILYVSRSDAAGFARGEAYIR